MGAGERMLAGSNNNMSFQGKKGYVVIRLDDPKPFIKVAKNVSDERYHIVELVKQLALVGVSGGKAYIVFEYNSDDLRPLRGNGIYIYKTTELPEFEEQGGEPKPIETPTLKNIIETLKEIYGELEEESDPLEAILSIQGPIIEQPEIDMKTMGLQILETELDKGLLFNAKRNLPKIARKLVIDFTDRYHVITPVRGKAIIGIFCFDGRRYVECENFIKQWLKAVYDYNDIDNYGLKFTSLKKEFMTQLEAYTIDETRYEYLAIAFRNIVLDWKALLENNIDETFKEFSPELFVRHYIPWDIDVEIVKKHYLDEYTPEKFEELAKQYTPNFYVLFKQWTNEHWINLYEIIGYTLYPKYDLHKAIMLVGSGRNGKSTFLGLLKRILGSENVVSKSLQELTDERNRFSIVALYGKLANIYADLPRQPIKYTGKFKILTGEDTITADRKFRDPITFVNYAKLIFSANELPEVNDMTLAFWRRWIVIEFPNQFTPIPNFLNKVISSFKDEIPKLIALSVLAIKGVLARGKFTYEGQELDYKEKWLTQSDPVYAFLKDITESGKYAFDKNGYVGKDEFYQEFVEWFKDHEEEYSRMPDKRAFTLALQKYGIRRVKIHGKYYYKGIVPVKTFETE